jgi:hypothetical protein
MDVSMMESTIEGMMVQKARKITVKLDSSRSNWR